MEKNVDSLTSWQVVGRWNWAQSRWVLLLYDISAVKVAFTQSDVIPSLSWGLGPKCQKTLKMEPSLLDEVKHWHVLYDITFLYNLVFLTSLNNKFQLLYVVKTVPLTKPHLWCRLPRAEMFKCLAGESLYLILVSGILTWRSPSTSTQQLTVTLVVTSFHGRCQRSWCTEHPPPV